MPKRILSGVVISSNSNKTKSFLTKGMDTLNKSNLKNIFKDIASA